MKELHPLIKQVADHYGFSYDYHPEMKKWTIKAQESNCYFFWDSSWNPEHQVEGFFAGLKRYFKDIGAEEKGW